MTQRGLRFITAFVEYAILPEISWQVNYSSYHHGMHISVFICNTQFSLTTGASMVSCLVPVAANYSLYVCTPIDAHPSFQSTKCLTTKFIYI